MSQNAPPPQVPENKPRMSTTKKVVLLAGAAALYYMYEHHKTAQAGQPQYYLSKNGRVYYRDSNHRAHYVSAPSQPIEVPADEADKYKGYQGYDNRAEGRDLRSVGSDSEE